MKHIFLINPAAGNGKAGTAILPEIISSVKNAGVSYDIHRTVNVGDATHYVREKCEEAPDEEKRFYACGGDGTVNEVLNGLIGEKRAQLAVIPVGTGNDFVRNFGDAKHFRDIRGQLDGSPVTVDALRYEFIEQTDETEAQLAASEIRIFPRTGYAINMFNMGFDAEVVAKTAELKRNPLISGPAAYISGVASVLAKLRKLPLSIEVDGEMVGEGDYLLAGAANGRFSGGGFDGMPVALTNDGLMNVLAVKSVTRRFFISIVKKYHDGAHLDDERLAGVLAHYACAEAVFRAKRPMTFAVDGETTVTTAVRVSVVPAAVSFSVPRGIGEERSKGE
ncbi:MAG: diacylglycerol kinase family lipid kinase [Clostridiales Family XIII bacterium]|jgi:YegS/Rv2252/BmrU family lipid kinase|nr:diacylglycerol kinase family lipid kinase [Clostridiales Family XIII bacterium]